MLRFISRRILVIPFALALIHFLGFTYAYVARPIRAARTPYLREEASNPLPLMDMYQQHLQEIVQGTFDAESVTPPELAEMLKNAIVASLGLLTLALFLSVIFGLFLGMQAVRAQPPGVHRWLTPLATIGLAMPSFYLGSLGILAVVYSILWLGPGSQSLLPAKGFGWDRHLVLPTLALLLRPTVQIAQVTSGLLAGELGKQYIAAARSFGHTWRSIRWKHAMRNILAPVILTIAGSLRLMVGELVVVEWLFDWPGLGNLLASTLIPGTLSTRLGATIRFLNPPLVAAIVTLIGALFLLADLAASIIVRVVDPRLRPHDETTRAGG